MSERFKTALENLLIVLGIGLGGLLIVAGIVISFFSFCIEIVEGILLMR